MSRTCGRYRLIINHVSKWMPFCKDSYGVECFAELTFRVMADDLLSIHSLSKDDGAAEKKL